VTGGHALLRPGARGFHATDRAALPLILRHGLLPAEALCALFAVPEPRRGALLGQNRDRYERLDHPALGTAWLRRQSLREAPLAARLAPGVTPEGWRRFINAHVFLFASRARALRLAGSEPGRDQVVLGFELAALRAAGLTLLASPINAGWAGDRQPPGRRRLRNPGLYAPVESLAPGAPVAELAVPGGLPPGLPFTLEPAAPQRA